MYLAPLSGAKFGNKRLRFTCQRTSDRAQKVDFQNQNMCARVAGTSLHQSTLGYILL